MQIELTEGGFPMLNVKADPQGEDVQPSQLLAAVEPFKTTGVRVQIHGHLRFSADMQFTDFKNLEIVGIGRAVLEQKHAYNDATPLGLTNCQDVRVSNLWLCGTGAPRPDGSPPQQNGLRIKLCRDVYIEKCLIEPLAATGTIKHAISVIDNSHRIWVTGNRFRRTTAAAVITGSGIWPHPTDPQAFAGHKCTSIRIENNDFEGIGTAVLIDDATALSWVVGNRVKLSYGNAIAATDGSLWFEIRGNICGPARAAAVVIGHGQSNVWASRGIVIGNMAAGCNNPNIQAPPGFYSDNPRAIAFDGGSGGHVILSSNLDVPGG